MKNTRNIAFLSIVAVVSANTLYANGAEWRDDDDTKTIVYQYDAAGNRTARGYNPVSQQQGRMAKGSSIDIADITQSAGGNDFCTITLSPSVSLENCTLSIHDLSGKLVCHEKLDGYKTDYDMSGLRMGSYIVTVTTDKGSSSAKIIINGRP